MCGEEKQRLKQMEINCKWLVEVIDQMHDIICPGQYGTWQDRARQVLEAVKGHQTQYDRNNKTR